MGCQGGQWQQEEESLFRRTQERRQEKEAFAVITVRMNLNVPLLLSSQVFILKMNNSNSFWTSSLGTSSPRLQRMLSSSASIMVPLLFLSNFLPSSSVCPWATQAFLVMFRPRAYMTSPRKKRSISPLPFSGSPGSLSSSQE